MSGRKLEFGYYPRDLSVAAGAVTITALPDLTITVASMESSEGAENGWIYAPQQQVRDFMTGGVRDRPYSSRVFGLPKTHSISHSTAASDEQLDFHLWSLSFFTGMRLTATEAGFLDATPITPGKLVDFVLLEPIETAVHLAEAFWIANRGTPERISLAAAAIHALFLSQGPQLLQFERFIYGYTALDACYALRRSIHPGRAPSHAARIRWLCDEFGMATPNWAAPAGRGSSVVADLRNATLHEAAFVGAPLGFALHGVGTNQNLTLEMKALTCRILVALLGAPHADYVRTKVTTRQRQGLRLT